MNGNSSKGFSKEYWDKNYDDPQSMDGVGNALAHASYIKAVFELDQIDISSVIDLGFGLGYVFAEVLKQFIPHRALGIEPSRYVFEQVLERDIRPVESTELELKCWDIETWARKGGRYTDAFDLGICTSVFQYLTEEQIDFVLPILAARVKYLYFSVPTNKELDRMIEEVDFDDIYAIRRSRSFYQKKIRRYFTFISSKILESKVFFNENDTFFTDLLFRY